MLNHFILSNSSKQYSGRLEQTNLKLRINRCSRARDCLSNKQIENSEEGRIEHKPNLQKECLYFHFIDIIENKIGRGGHYSDYYNDKDNNGKINGIRRRNQEEN